MLPQTAKLFLILHKNTLLIGRKISETLRIKAIQRLHYQRKLDFKLLGKQGLEKTECIAKNVVGNAHISKTKYNIIYGTFVEMCQQLLNTKLKHDSQPRAIKLEQNQNAIQVLVAIKHSQNVGHILLIKLNTTSIPDTWRINKAYRPRPDSNKVY